MIMDETVYPERCSGIDRDVRKAVQYSQAAGLLGMSTSHNKLSLNLEKRSGLII
jgi:hypothetical protein